MRIFMFMFVGIALGDKLDRTYLPPPGSKFAGGSPGALQTPLEYPKENYSPAGGIGSNAENPFDSNKRPNNLQQIQERLPSESQGPTGGATFSPDRQYQQFNQQGFLPTGQSAFGPNQQKAEPGVQGFAPNGPQSTNARPTYGSNQADGNLLPTKTDYTTTGSQYPNGEQNFELNQGPMNVPQGFIPSKQQRPNAGQTFNLNQGQPQLDSQGFIQPGQLPSYQQYPPASSTQSPLNTYQGNLPSTTTTYAFTQTTISPFDDVPGTVPPFGFDGQQGYNIPVQVNYPQSGFAPDQSTAKQQGQQTQNSLPISQQGIINSQDRQTGQFTKQESLPGQSYVQGSKQNQEYDAPEQSDFIEPKDGRNQLQQQNYNQRVPTGPVYTQKTSSYSGSESALGTPQSEEQISSYQPSRGSVFQQKVPTTPGTLSQSGGQYNIIPSSAFPEGQPQNQYERINNSNEYSQKLPQNQYMTPTSAPTQTYPQRPNQYQNQFSPVTSTTVSPFDQVYSSPGSQNIDGYTQRRSEFTTPGLVSQPTTPGNFISSTASSFSPNDNINTPSTPTYPAGQIQQSYGQNKPERVKAGLDRNAVILNYVNNLTPEGEFNYSFDTSNGIHADENGTSMNGVRAQGSFSYIGDDGKTYSVTYTADENGFVPMGEHLLTPPPIPDAIKRVIEQAMRDKEAGIFHDGSYDEAKYGHEKYKKKTQRYKPSQQNLKKNKITSPSVNYKQVGIIGTEESVNEDRDLDYETLEDEIEDIKNGNKKPSYLDKNDSVDTTDDLINYEPGYETKKPSDRPQTTKIQQKSGSKNEITETGDNTEDENLTTTKIPKSDRQRPTSVSFGENSFEKYESDEEKPYESKKYSKIPKPNKSERRRPSYETTKVAEEDEISDTNEDNVTTLVKPNRRKPSVEISTSNDSNIDVGSENRPSVYNTKDNKPLKRPKPFDRQRPVTTISNSENDEDESEKSTGRPQSSKSDKIGPSFTDEKVFNEHEDDEPEYQKKITPIGPQSSKLNKKRPGSTVSDGTQEDDEDNTGYENEKSSKRLFDRRRPGFKTPDTDDDINISEVEESKQAPKSRPQNKKRPTTSQISGQDDELKYKTKKILKRPEVRDKEVDEGIEEDFEENVSIKRPKPNVVQPTDSVTQDEYFESDLKSKKPAQKFESYRRRPSATGYLEESSSRKPINRRPEVTVSSSNSPEDEFNTAQPYDDIFGDKEESLSKFDQQTKTQRPTGTKKEPSSIFEEPEKEDDYDYSLSEETENKKSKIPKNKKQKPQKNKPISITTEGYDDEEEGDNFEGDTYNKPTGGSNKGQKITKPSDIISKDDNTKNKFEQTTKISPTQRYPYSTRKPFTKDGDKGYQYLPPQNQFNEQPGRFPGDQNEEVRQPNQGFIDRKPASGFQTTSGPYPQGQFQSTLPQNKPTSYDENRYEQNVTPSSFAPGKIETQTVYDTDFTRRPSYTQTNQRIPSQNAQNYPVTERNRYQTPGSIPEGSSTTPTPASISTYRPNPGNAFGDRFSTTANPFGPSPLDNKNYYSEARPTYLPSTKKPFGEFNQVGFPSGNMPSTTYRPNYSTTTPGTKYDPNFGADQQGYDINQYPSQSPMYGPASAASDRNVYPIDGPNNQPIRPGLPQISTSGPTFSTTEYPKQEYGFDQKGNRVSDIGYEQQMFDNVPGGDNKVIGEDFSGPKRPQTFDPNTGYHYK